MAYNKAEPGTLYLVSLPYQATNTFAWRKEYSFLSFASPVWLLRNGMSAGQAMNMLQAKPEEGSQAGAKQFK